MKRLLPVLAVALLCAPASAQINVEPLRSRVANERLSGNFDLALNGSLGNTNSMELGVGGQVGYSHGWFLAFVNGRIDHVSFDGQTKVAKAFWHSRINLRTNSWLATELFWQVQTDQFWRLQLRELLGVGKRVRLVQTKNFAAYAGAGIMAEVDQLAPLFGTNDPLFQRYIRFNTYVAVSLLHSFFVTGYFQPKTSAFTDFRTLVESTFKFAIKKRFTVSIIGSFRWDQSPPSNVKPFDLTLKNSFGITW